MLDCIGSTELGVPLLIALSMGSVLQVLVREMADFSQGELTHLLERSCAVLLSEVVLMFWPSTPKGNYSVGDTTVTDNWEWEINSGSHPFKFHWEFVMLR